LKSVKNTSAKISALYAILAGIVFGAGFYTYIAYRVTPLLFLLFIPYFRKYPAFCKKISLFIATTFVVALPIGIYFLQHPGDFFGRTSEIAVTNSSSPLLDFVLNVIKTALMFNIRGDGNWRHNVSGAPELFWPVGILFLIGIGLGLYMLWKHFKIRNQKSVDKKIDALSTTPYEFSLFLIFSWLILAGLPAAASNDGIPHALRSILMLPPAIMLCAIGGIWLYHFLWDRWNKKLVAAIGLLFLASVAIFAYVDYFIIWAKNPDVAASFNADYVAIGDQMNALPQSTPKYVVVNAGGVLARGIPVPAETVMFVTDSFTTSTQLAKHITYLLPDQIGEIPPGTTPNTIFEIN
jgi:hypothetical protein